VLFRSDQSLANAYTNTGSVVTGEGPQRASNDYTAQGSFGDAFKAARDQLGANATFTYNGKSYTTATAPTTPVSEWDTNAGPKIGMGNYGTSTTPTSTTTASTTGNVQEAPMGYDPNTGLPIGGGLVGSFKEGSVADNIYKTVSSAISNTSQFGLSTTMLAASDIAGQAQGVASAITGTPFQNSTLNLVSNALQKNANLIDPTSAQQSQNIINDISKADGLSGKVGAFFSGIASNPRGWAQMVASEGLQEVLPTKFASTIGRFGGVIAGLGADLGANALESVGAAYKQAMQDLTSQGLTEAQAHDKATQAGVMAGVATLATAGALEPGMVKALGNILPSSF
jgi:hypothetical protein